MTLVPGSQQLQTWVPFDLHILNCETTDLGTKFHVGRYVTEVRREHYLEFRSLIDSVVVTPLEIRLKFCIGLRFFLP